MQLGTIKRSYTTNSGIQASGKPIHLSQIRSLHNALRHLLLPVSNCNYDKNAITNLSSFTKLADEYYERLKS